MPQPTAKNDPEIAERWSQALNLRLAGASYEAIARRLGYGDHSGARYAVSKAMERSIQEPADEYRKLELERLDRLQLGLWDRGRQNPTVRDTQPNGPARQPPRRRQAPRRAAGQAGDGQGGA